MPADFDIHKDLTSRLPSGAKIAAAFSGGGDSTALVHMLRGLHPKPDIFIVDHALRAGSGPEARLAKDFAESLGLRAQVLRWQNNSPRTGLQEKARKARYALLGQACRARGITHLLTAHTQDDQAETLLMRYDRGTDWRGAGGMQALVYAPLWPELADVHLVRPLLGVTREYLRSYNRAHDLTWSEDPSNANRDFTRIRSRDYLASRPHQKEILLSAAADIQRGLADEAERLRAQLAQHVQISSGLAFVTGPISPRLLGYLLRAVSGTGGPLDQTKLGRLYRAAMGPDFQGATLGGARVQPVKKGLVIGSDPRDYVGQGKRAALEAVNVARRQPVIWRGRVSVDPGDESAEILAARRAFEVLGSEQTRALRNMLSALPPHFRDTAPVVIFSNGRVVTSFGEIGIGVPDTQPVITCLVAQRLHNALSVR